VHTCYSHDCSTSLQELSSFIKRTNLDGVVITDHNTVEGALKLSEIKNKGFLVIPGIEISSKKGHIIGLNITEIIPPNLSIKDTVTKIHKLGGIAIVPHPSAIFKGGIGLSQNIKTFGIDAIEVYNSANIPFSILTFLNKKLAKQTGLPYSAGSDSHILETVGLSYIIIEKNQIRLNINDVIKVLMNGETVAFGKPMSWRSRLKKMLNK
jgi:predicted metal-dependent phosphoesterase TrpH